MTVINVLPGIRNSDSAKLEVARKLTADDFVVERFLADMNNLPDYTFCPGLVAKLKPEIVDEIGPSGLMAKTYMLASLSIQNRPYTSDGFALYKSAERFETRGANKAGRFLQYLTENNERFNNEGIDEFVDYANEQIKKFVDKHNKAVDKKVVEIYSNANSYDFSGVEEVADIQAELNELRKQCSELEKKVADAKVSTVENWLGKEKSIPEELVPKITENLKRKLMAPSPFS